MTAALQHVDLNSTTITRSVDQFKEKSSDCCGNIPIALGIITMIGSLAAAGWFYSQVGNWSIAIGAVGLVLGLGLIYWGCTRSEVEDRNFGETRGVPVRAEDVEVPESLPENIPENWDISGDKWLCAFHFQRYFLYLAVRFSCLAIRNRPADAVTIETLEAYLFDHFPKELTNFSQLNVPIFLHVSGNHAALVYIDRERRTVEFYDSKKEYGNYSEIRAKLQGIAARLSLNEPDQPAYRMISKIQKELQPDSYQCGVWILYFLESRLINPDFNFNQLDTQEAQPLIAKYRQKVQLTLAEMYQLSTAIHQRELDYFFTLYSDSDEARCKHDEEVDKVPIVERWRQIFNGQSLVPV